MSRAKVIDSADVPQADSLERVRDAVEAIAHQASTPAQVAHRTGLSPRHVGYYLGAAASLGLAHKEPNGAYVLDDIGTRLLATERGSDQESQTLKDAIRASWIINAIQPRLLDDNSLGIDEVARAIQERTPLGATTAKRRARTLIAWRDFVARRERQLSLPHHVGRTASNGRKLPRGHSVERPQVTALRLQNFKNFADEILHLGPLTVLVGANASGKSNLRDAFRFLHGVARGYTLAEIIGEKWIEGGVLQWKGIRGGTRETAYRGAAEFTLAIELRVKDGKTWRNASYSVSVGLSKNIHGPRVTRERLVLDGRGTYVFDSHPEGDVLTQDQPNHLKVRLRKKPAAGFRGPTVALFDNRPALSQLVDRSDVQPEIREHVRLVLAALQSVRFLDLSPDAMRNPSIPGQTILGDRGENLSSVLQAICDNPSRKRALLEWIRELTPLDVHDFEFAADPTGRILVSLIEDEGHRTSAYSASDGTLRFLAMIAALLGPEPANLYFFEELENGIHPTRLHLLLQLIEQQTSRHACQVIATTHSPFLLTYLAQDSLASASLVHRGQHQPTARVIRIVDIPNIRKVLEKQDLARLHGTGWLENAVILSAEEP